MYRDVEQKVRRKWIAEESHTVNFYLMNLIVVCTTVAYGVILRKCIALLAWYSTLYSVFVITPAKLRRALHPLTKWLSAFTKLYDTSEPVLSVLMLSSGLIIRIRLENLRQLPKFGTRFAEF